MAASVLLLRHAPSVWNVQARWQGRADPPLSDAGIGLARSAAARLEPVDLVITSDLDRAATTGRLLAPGVPALVDGGLGEYDIGAWSGLTRSEISQRWPAELDAFDAGRLDTPPGGESRQHFEMRVAAAARRVAGHVAEMGAARALVVTHAGVLRALSRLGGLTDRHVEHLCGYQAEDKEGALVLVSPTCLSDPVSEPSDRVDPNAV